MPQRPEIFFSLPRLVSESLESIEEAGVLLAQFGDL
jgi:hypothetical protein